MGSAQSRECPPTWPKIVTVWPALPEAVKAGILAMVRAASEAGVGKRG